MKKEIIGIILGILVLTGCQKETSQISCIKKEQDIDTQLKTILNGDVITQMSLNIKKDISNLDEERLKLFKEEDLCATFKNSVSLMQDALKNCQQEINNKTITITSELDITKMKEEIGKKETSKDEIKSFFEKDGYTCTIKQNME